jgi:hypothetical protein
MKKLNSNHLKLIAIIAMTIDYLGDLIIIGILRIVIYGNIPLLFN